VAIHRAGFHFRLGFTIFPIFNAVYSRNRHGNFGHLKAVTAIILTLTLTLTLTLVYATLYKKDLKSKKYNHSVGVEPATYAVHGSY